MIGPHVDETNLLLKLQQGVNGLLFRNIAEEPAIDKTALMESMRQINPLEAAYDAKAVLKRKQLTLAEFVDRDELKEMLRLSDEEVKSLIKLIKLNF